MLAIQVAAGIVLAYIIIVNQRRILAAGWLLLLVVLGCTALFAAVWAGGAAIDKAEELFTLGFWRKVWMLVGLVPVFVLIFTGTLGMAMLGGLVVRKDPTYVGQSALKKIDADPGKPNENSGCFILFGLLLLTMLVNFGLSFPVWAYTPIGRWYQAIDAYGRSNGWDDGLTIMFGALLWQWVWIPLGINYWVQRARRTSAVDESAEEPHMDGST